MQLSGLHSGVMQLPESPSLLYVTPINSLAHYAEIGWNFSFGLTMSHLGRSIVSTSLPRKIHPTVANTSAYYKVTKYLFFSLPQPLLTSFLISSYVSGCISSIFVFHQALKLPTPRQVLYSSCSSALMLQSHTFL